MPLDDYIHFLNCVSPSSGTPLHIADDALVSEDGEIYPIKNGIADLLNPLHADAEILKEISVFDHLPIRGVCYFRPSLFTDVFNLLSRLRPAGISPTGKKNLACIEIGGGEGYFADAFKRAYPDGESYIADLSLKQMERAPDHLIKIRCDIRQPYLKETTIDLAVFWVSLHHLARVDIQKAIAQVRSMMRSQGLLVIFEPNSLFFPRQVLMHSGLKNLVYFDEAEKPLSPEALLNQLKLQGFAPLFFRGLNPPYNMDFLVKLKFGRFFYMVTELFYLIQGQITKNSPTPLNLPLALGSYFLAVFRLNE